MTIAAGNSCRSSMLVPGARLWLPSLAGAVAEALRARWLAGDLPRTPAGVFARTSNTLTSREMSAAWSGLGGTGLRAGALPSLELNTEVQIEELSVHQLAQELQERTDRLMQLDTLAESLVLQVADREVTIDEQEQLIDEQRQLLSLSAEKMAKLTSNTEKHQHQPPPPQQQGDRVEEEAPAGKVNALESARSCAVPTLVYGVCTAIFFVVLVS